MSLLHKCDVFSNFRSNLVTVCWKVYADDKRRRQCDVMTIRVASLYTPPKKKGRRKEEQLSLSLSLSLTHTHRGRAETPVPCPYWVGFRVSPYRVGIRVSVPGRYGQRLGKPAARTQPLLARTSPYHARTGSVRARLLG